MTGPDDVSPPPRTSTTASGERDFAGCLAAMRGVTEVLAGVSGVTWLAVFPARGHNTMPRVHVLVESPDAVHALAHLEAEEGTLPAYDDGAGRTDPSWAGRIRGVWLHVGVDFDERSLS